MLSLLDLEQSETRNSHEIGSVRSLCADHALHVGKPEDLLAFTWQISQDPELEVAFTSLIHSLQRGDQLAGSFPEILSVVLVGIGGRSATRSAPELLSSTGLLISVLLGAGGWSATDLEEATRLEDRIRVELSTEPARHFSPEIAELTDRSEDLSATESTLTLENAPSTDARHLINLIARLEQSNLELRQKLETIDQRIRRMQPADNAEPASPASADAHPVPRASAVENAYTSSRPLAEDTGSGRPDSEATVEPLPAPHPPRTRFLTDEEHRADQRRISAPLRRRRLVQAAVFASALLAAGGGVLYNSLHHGSASSPISDGSAAASPGGITTSGAVSSIAANPTEDAAKSAGDAGDGTNPEPASSAPATIYSAVPAVPTQPKNASSRIRNRHLMEAGPAPEASASMRGTAAFGSTSASGAEPLSVSSTVMARRLLSSTPPSYPRLANLSGLQGVVVLKATIARDGSVEHVQALGGHYLLRGAAASAVRSWRYRPYLVNGQPVEVATLVTIDFALHR